MSSIYTWDYMVKITAQPNPQEKARVSYVLGTLIHQIVQKIEKKKHIIKNKNLTGWVALSSNEADVI